MRIGLFPGVSTTGLIGDVIADVQLAHEQGFSAYWVPQFLGWDALTLLALVGRESEGIELGTSVVPTFPRHPAALAAQALTTQAACSGRFTLGLGLSHKPVVEGWYGMSYDRPLRHLQEYLDVLLPLLAGERVDTTGECFSARLALDIPASRPVPVLVAALGPKMLHLAGSRTAGTITWMTGPATIAAHTVPEVRAAADEGQRPPPRVVCGLPVCVTDDVAGARERATAVYGFYGHLPSYRAMLDREGADGPADIALIGDEDHVAGRLEELQKAGVTDFAASEFSPVDTEGRRTRELLCSLVRGRP